MESQTRIMVCIAEPEWTEEAIYQACVLTRKTQGELDFVKMVPVQHLGWLGTEFGNMNLTPQDRQLMERYSATAEDYGVAVASHYFQYVTLPEAIVQAAGYVKADVVFATLPKSLIPFWRRFQIDLLRLRLAQEKRVLVDQASVEVAFRSRESVAR